MGSITGAHRTWLDPEGFDPVLLGKAPIDTPRCAMGDLLGNAVRFGVANDVLATGEGIETMLSLRCVLPTLPMAAALSANHLAALLLPPTLRRLYVARDDDAAGEMAAAALTERAEATGVETVVLDAQTRRFQRGSACLRPGWLRQPAGSARSSGCRPLHAPADPRNGVTSSRSSVVIVGQARPDKPIKVRALAF